MNDFLLALKADLLDRRLRALLILLAAGLIAALAYALLGGGAAEAPATGPGGTGAGLRGSITPVAVGANPNQALAETPGGSSKQRRGSSRDPFNPLPGTTTSTTSTASKGSTGSSESKSSGGAAPSPGKSEPSKPKTTYAVSILLGQVPPGTPAQVAQLTPYESLKFQQKLPSPELRLLSFDGVTSDGKKAKFKVIGELIPRGDPAACSPSITQCQTIELEASQADEFEYLPASGAAVVYELQVVGVKAETH